MHDICNSYLVPINLKDYSECAWRLCGIYKITNKISGKCYIGQAVDIRKRLQQHVASYIRKSTFSKEELLDRIDWFNSQEYINKKKHRKRGRL